jgi:hypothetical protein
VKVDLKTNNSEISSFFIIRVAVVNDLAYIYISLCIVNSINRKEEFKLIRVWDPSCGLLGHSSKYSSGKSQEKIRACFKEDQIVDNKDTGLSDIVIG